MAGTNLKAEFGWGTGMGKVHIVPAGKAYSFARSKCGVRAEVWGARFSKTLEEVRETGHGFCARCAHYVSECTE